MCIPDTWSELFVLTLPAQTDQEAQYFKDFSNTNIRPDGINRRIQEAAKAIWETKDIRDELRLLRQLFESQAEVIGDLAEIFWPTKAYGGEDRESRQVLKENFIRDCGLEALIRRVKKMDDDAATTSDGVSFFSRFHIYGCCRELMKMTTQLANVIQAMQAQASLKEAEEARILNTVILPFTIVTVIFVSIYSPQGCVILLLTCEQTPLSFLTSLFAVNTDAFPHNSEGELRLPASWFTWRIGKQLA